VNYSVVEKKNRFLFFVGFLPDITRRKFLKQILWKDALLVKRRRTWADNQCIVCRHVYCFICNRSIWVSRYFVKFGCRKKTSPLHKTQKYTCIILYFISLALILLSSRANLTILENAYLYCTTPAVVFSVW
jgi:hypothetical protein